jgi:hypothetical protein
MEMEIMVLVVLLTLVQTGEVLMQVVVALADQGLQPQQHLLEMEVMVPPNGLVTQGVSVQAQAVVVGVPLTMVPVQLLVMGEIMGVVAVQLGPTLLAPVVQAFKALS